MLTQSARSNTAGVAISPKSLHRRSASRRMRARAARMPLLLDKSRSDTDTRVDSVDTHPSVNPALGTPSRHPAANVAMLAKCTAFLVMAVYLGIEAMLGAKATYRSRTRIVAQHTQMTFVDTHGQCGLAS